MRTALLIAAVLALPVVQAVEDPGTYPAGVDLVDRAPVAPGGELEVTARTSEAFDRAVVTVCRFEALDAPEPSLCYMNIAAEDQDGRLFASTASHDHPSWKQGWVLGYKFSLYAGDDARHAPMSGDYYRLEVGRDAVVEVDALPSTQAAESSLGPVALVVALALAAARRW